MIKSLPIEENPREKALLYGIDHLSDIELLAICLRTGSKKESVLALAGRLLKETGGLNGLMNISYHQLTSLKGIKDAKAIEIMAICELAKRFHQPIKARLSLNKPADIYRYMQDMASLKQEHFEILILDSKHRLITRKLMFMGASNVASISVREIFSEVLSYNGVALIAVHNHPSGDALPSQEDEWSTASLMQAGEMMGIDVLDHIIIGMNQYYSMKAETLLLFTVLKY